MWKQIVDLGKKVFTLTQDTQKNKEDMKALQIQVEKLTEAVRLLATEQQRDRDNAAHERDNAAHEREKLVLRLEVALLRSERRLLGAGEAPKLLLDDTGITPPTQP